MGGTLGFENKKFISNYATLSCSCIFFSLCFRPNHLNVTFLSEYVFTMHMNLYIFSNESDTLPHLETEGYIIQHFLAVFSPWEFKAAVSYFSWLIALTHTLTVWVINWCHRKWLIIPEYVNKIKAPILIHEYLTT